MSSTRSSALSEKVGSFSSLLDCKVSWSTHEEHTIEKYHHLIFSQGMLGENSANSLELHTCELECTATRASRFARNLDNLFVG